MNDTTLTGILSRLATRNTDSLAIIYGPQTMSFGFLEEQSRRIASALAKQGLGRGDRIAMWLPNIPAYLLLSFASWRLGATVVSLNTRFRSSEVEHVLKHMRPKFLAIWPNFNDIDYGAVLSRVSEETLSCVDCVIEYGEDTSSPPSPAMPLPGVRRSYFNEMLLTAPTDDNAATADSPCVVFTTSGTTKAPKFVLHRQAGLAQHAKDVAGSLGFDAADAMTLQALPLCAVFGLTQALAALAGGRPQIVMTRFDAEEAADMIQAHSVTHLMGTDDLFIRLLAVRPNSPIPYPSLRMCGYAAFNPAVNEFLTEADARGLPLVGVFGMSEVMALFALQRSDAPREIRHQCGGYPVSPETVVRVRDGQSGELLAPNNSGLLEVRGPSMMIGYAGDPEATRAAFTEDGFLRTGDLGYLRGDGSFVYESRLSDVLRLGGFLVSPREVEAYLEEHPYVDGVQVVAADTPKGPRAVAFVILRKGAEPTEDELREYCAGNLAKYKVPARFVSVSAFPVTQSGNGTKIQREKLRSMAQQFFDNGAT